ncbi:hypothetical protein FOA43_004051 [Brettanomyces nanus]|uniref:E3 ubiquitin ligase complex SCF subunit n=1 Tax=Eeniella nana TaxID=13502 RepID=A0A875SAR4_EENNA|nr:uncharacterized protein FOA43_004051 [Brettanomyces nanus]QPG76659.1 hypothetical protein FOA43_004051 [Brettanomyces nanus]
MTETRVILVSGDEKFTANRKAVEKSRYIRNLLKNLAPAPSPSPSVGEINETPESIPEIPVNNVSPDTLKMVLEWCEHYKDGLDDDEAATTNGEDESLHLENKDGDQDENQSDLRQTPIDPWDRKFLNVDADTLQSLILAANFLDIKPLLDAACKLVAELLRGRTPQEIIDAFNAVQ